MLSSFSLVQRGEAFPLAPIKAQSDVVSCLCRPSQGTEDVRRYGKFPTPSRRVQATALRAPLQITNTEIGFHLPPGYYDMGIENAAGRTEVSSE